jgi:maleate isomerase
MARHPRQRASDPPPRQFNHAGEVDVKSPVAGYVRSTPSKPGYAPMPFSSWRGIVGMINPTMRPGVTEEVIRLLPPGIGLIPLFLDFRRGSSDEFKAAMPAYERNIALLAEQACDLIHPVGAPPFMVLGRKAEARLVASWERKYKATIFTVAQNHVAALKALKARTIVGATYFPGKINGVFAKYFEDAGFTVRGMEGIEVPFDKVQELSGEQVYAHIKASFLRHKGADAIYMLGSGWRTLDIIELLERDLQTPVVHPVTARVWEIQKRLRVREPRLGYGHMLEALP